MSDWNFSDLGKQIGKTVDDVLNSKEVKDLSSNIKNTVESSIDTVRDSVTGAADNINKSVKWEKVQVPVPVRKQLPAVKTPEEKTMATIMMVLGGIGSAIFGLAALVAVVGGLGAGMAASLIPALVLAVPWMICSAVNRGGRKISRRIKRFKIYKRNMERDGFCSVKELAGHVRKKENFVVRDLNRMMRDRWFLEGHFDAGNTYFMLTDEAYQQYCLAEQARIDRERQEQKSLESKEQESSAAEGGSEADQIIMEGKKYICEIRSANDDIEGEEISQKLDRLELITSKIFDHVERHPDKLPDIRRFMEYYLPTTMKLIYQYREFDAQPVQGENIRKGKREIESTLDTINTSFERLFDQLFQDEMLDVSTDISVLSTMLAQAGLSGSDFERKSS